MLDKATESCESKGHADSDRKPPVTGITTRSTAKLLVGEALRRNCAAAIRAGGACAVIKLQLSALDQGSCHGCKTEAGPMPRHTNDAYAFG